MGEIFYIEDRFSDHLKVRGALSNKVGWIKIIFKQKTLNHTFIFLYSVDLLNPTIFAALDKFLAVLNCLSNKVFSESSILYSFCSLNDYCYL